MTGRIEDRGIALVKLSSHTIAKRRELSRRFAATQSHGEKGKEGNYDN